jgi:seryl-tRNA synthetase
MAAATEAELRNTADDAILDRLFRPMGVDGVYARTRVYEDVIDALQRLISRWRPDDAEVFRFPPVMSLRQLETSGYLNSFPQLLGCVCCLHGTERDISAAVARAKQGADWTKETSATDLVLSPAACYPVYPIAAKRGPLDRRGLTFDVAADCFRHEPSREIDRLQSFRMREFVRVGAPSQVATFREQWMKRAEALAKDLRLPYVLDRASDPFFGRVGQLMAANQIEESLKFELLVPVRSYDGPTACMSFNYHRDHFGKTWSIVDEAGVHAHTGCVAFGIDRLTLALFATHGLDLENWPRDVLEVLRLS